MLCNSHALEECESMLVRRIVLYLNRVSFCGPQLLMSKQCRLTVTELCLVSDRFTLLLTINMRNTVLHVSNLIPVHLQGPQYFYTDFFLHQWYNLYTG